MPIRIARRKKELTTTALMILVTGNDFFHEYRTEQGQKHLHELWKQYGQRILKAVAPITPAAAAKYDGEVSSRGHFTMDRARILLAQLQEH